MKMYVLRTNNVGVFVISIKIDALTGKFFHSSLALGYWQKMPTANHQPPNFNQLTNSPINRFT